MDNKLQELTNRLYEEGLSKGKAEGEEIIAKARMEADEIIKKAEDQARDILSGAKKEAEDMRTKVGSDLKMASEQMLQATRKDIENLIISKSVELETGKAVSCPDFLKEIIRTIAEKFSSEASVDLAVVLPEKLKAEMEPFIKNELKGILGKEIKADFSKKISGGFTIGPKDGSYYVSFTDETFKELIGEYFRPLTKKLLFG